MGIDPTGFSGIRQMFNSASAMLSKYMSPPKAPKDALKKSAIPSTSEKLTSETDFPDTTQAGRDFKTNPKNTRNSKKKIAADAVRSLQQLSRTQSFFSRSTSFFQKDGEIKGEAKEFFKKRFSQLSSNDKITTHDVRKLLSSKDKGNQEFIQDIITYLSSEEVNSTRKVQAELKQLKSALKKNGIAKQLARDNTGTGVKIEIIKQDGSKQKVSLQTPKSQEPVDLKDVLGSDIDQLVGSDVEKLQQVGSLCTQAAATQSIFHISIKLDTSEGETASNYMELPGTILIKKEGGDLIVERTDDIAVYQGSLFDNPDIEPTKIFKVKHTFNLSNPDSNVETTITEVRPSLFETFYPQKKLLKEFCQGKVKALDKLSIEAKQQLIQNIERKIESGDIKSTTAVSREIQGLEELLKYEGAVSFLLPPAHDSTQLDNLVKFLIENNIKNFDALISFMVENIDNIEKKDEIVDFIVNNFDDIIEKDIVFKIISSESNKEISETNKNTVTSKLIIGLLKSHGTKEGGISTGVTANEVLKSQNARSQEGDLRLEQRVYQDCIKRPYVSFNFCDESGEQQEFPLTGTEQPASISFPESIQQKLGLDENLKKKNILLLTQQGAADNANEILLNKHNSEGLFPSGASVKTSINIKKEENGEIIVERTDYFNLFDPISQSIKGCASGKQTFNLSNPKSEVLLETTEIPAGENAGGTIEPPENKEKAAPQQQTTPEIEASSIATEPRAEKAEAEDYSKETVGPTTPTAEPAISTAEPEDELKPASTEEIFEEISEEDELKPATAKEIFEEIFEEVKDKDALELLKEALGSGLEVTVFDQPIEYTSDSDSDSDSDLREFGKKIQELVTEDETVLANILVLMFEPAQKKGIENLPISQDLKPEKQLVAIKRDGEDLVVERTDTYRLDPNDESSEVVEVKQTHNLSRTDSEVEVEVTIPGMTPEQSSLYKDLRVTLEGGIKNKEKRKEIIDNVTQKIKKGEIETRDDLMQEISDQISTR